MKAEIILWLALGLGGVLSGGSEIASAAETNAPAKLKIERPWEDCTVKLVVPGSTGFLAPTKSKCEGIQARCALYGYRFPVAAIFDPHTRKNYIISHGFGPGDRSFYISDRAGMMECQFFGGELVCRRSYIEMPESEGSMDDLIARFAGEFDEEKLAAQEEKNMFWIELNRAAPLDFFTAHSEGGSQPGTPSIRAIDFTDGILRLDMVSEGGKFTGSFWMDFKAKKVIRSVVDGQKMDLDPEKPWPVLRKTSQ